MTKLRNNILEMTKILTKIGAKEDPDDSAILALVMEDINKPDMKALLFGNDQHLASMITGYAAMLDDEQFNNFLDILSQVISDRKDIIYPLTAFNLREISHQAIESSSDEAADLIEKVLEERGSSVDEFEAVITELMSRYDTDEIMDDPELEKEFQDELREALGELGIQVSDDFEILNTESDNNQ